MLVVLWFMVLLAAVGTYLLANARSETALARNVLVAAKADALAETGIAQAVFNLTDPVPTRRWPLDGMPHQIKLPAGELLIRLRDEGAKINPNLASDALLTGLLQAVNIEPARSLRLGAAIADWVGSDDNPRPLGAKLEQYKAAGRSYGPPNGPMQSLDELQLVLGMTPEIFAAVRPYLTIYTASDAPDIKVASPVIRRALTIAAQLSPESGETDTPAEGAADTAPPVANAVATVAPGGAPKAPPQPIVNVEVIARTAEGGTSIRHAVLQLAPKNPKGYVTFDWRRGYLAE